MLPKAIWGVLAVVVGLPAAAQKTGPASWQNDLTPIAAGDWNYDLAGHLLNRAGFGGTPEEIQALAKVTPSQAIARLLLFEGTDIGKLRPFDESGIHDPGLEPFPPSRPALTDLAKEKGEALGITVKPGGNRPLQPIVDEFFYWLRASEVETNRVAYWWANRMMTSPQPLRERTVLFRHGHFASNEAKVRDYCKLLGEPAIFQNQGLGNFRDLTVAVAQSPVMNVPIRSANTDKPRRRFLLETARRAQDASALVREAWSRYRSPIDYGITGLDLPKVAALIDAGMPTRLYYTSYRNDAFDTHVFRSDTHKRLLTYASDAVYAFIRDLERIKRADDVVVMVFSEFGRRIPENVNLGTDRGTANLMFMAGAAVKGGHYGTVPSLTKLDAKDNLIFTTDFRRVYATMVSEWLGYTEVRHILNGDFPTFEMFRRRA